MKENSGKLYICGTPIGNLEDITIRVLNTLKSVDIIAAEDTRHTIKLLNHYEISKPLTSYHEHNKVQKGPELIEKLRNGETIALVSDAGMPGISDPGEDLVKLCIESNIDIEVIPGASAIITGLVASGLSTVRFSFEGFLDRNKKGRQERLNKIKNDERTLIFYESPHRVLSTLKDMETILENRKMVAARELTKRFEEIVRGSISEVTEYFKANGPRGEFVLIIEGNQNPEEPDENEKWNDLSINEHILYYMDSGESKKDSIKMVAKDRKIPKRDVYKHSLDI